MIQLKFQIKLNIEYKIDEEIALELDGKEIDIKDAIKNIDIKELEIQTRGGKQ